MSQNKPESCWIIYRSSWLDKNKKATINSINGNNKRFQYAATVALNQEEIEKK